MDKPEATPKTSKLKKIIGAFAVTALVGTCVAVARARGENKGPQAYEATVEERLGVLGVQAAQDELNQQSNELVAHARVRLGVPSNHRFWWAKDVKDSKNHMGVWVSQAPEPDPAAVSTAAVTSR